MATVRQNQEIIPMSHHITSDYPLAVASVLS
jgi:hypothetical protein